MKSKVAIIGESCIDEYVYGTCDRVCPEAAALCFKHDKNTTKTNVGMAGNVFANLQSFKDHNTDIDLITSETSIIKRRFVDKRYYSIVLREDVNDIVDQIDLKKYDFSKYDFIVFSDYNKGFITESDIEYICKKKKRSCVVFLDTKKYLSKFTRYIDIIKINSYEFEHNINIKKLYQITKKSKLIVTKGDAGATLLYKNIEKHYPTNKVLLRDVCGAGDTFLAALVKKFIETSDMDISISFANECAAKVVSQFGVVTL